MTAERRVMIVGAGIGGLTAAIALERAGWEVVLFERMEGLLDVGAGFIINVNAVTAMRDIGLDKEIENGGVAISSFAHRTTDGKLLANWDVGAISRKLGAPIVGISRPELQRPLVDALATTELRFGHECTGVEQDESGVTAHFANGAQERAGALVAADGADSRIRACFDQTPRRYAGYTTWLATSELDPGYAPATHTVWYGRSAIVGAHPVAGGKTKWYAAQTTPPGAPDFDLVGLFGDWTEPVPAIVDQTRPPQRFDVYDLPRREQWGSGRVTLLGDAAHPMVPALGQGACQAMEDGIVLARLLTPGADPAKALRAYERDRIERTAKIVKLSRIRGALMQGDNPAIRIARYCSLRVIPQSRLLKGFEKLGTFPATG